MSRNGLVGVGFLSMSGKWLLSRFFPLILWCAVLGEVTSIAAEKPEVRQRFSGYVHWYAAVDYMEADNCKGAMNESSYLLRHPAPDNAIYRQKTLIMHGECYEKLNKPAEAMKAYLAALKIYGKNEAGFLMLGELYLREENPQAAIKSFRGALSMNDKDPRTFRGLASAYLALGKLAEAKKNIDRAEELGADVGYLRDRLASSAR